MNSIHQSVGKNAVNNESDVELVQTLLNARGTTQPLLRVDKKMGALTIAAIEKFQSKVVGIQPDGVISPGLRTWNVLSKGQSNNLAHGGHNKNIGIGTPWPQIRVKDNSVDLNIDDRLINYLIAAGDFFGATLVVTSGLRDVYQQSDSMWNNWDAIMDKKSTLHYIYLEQNPKVKAQLNEFCAKGDKNSFTSRIKEIGKDISRHLVGEAVDIKLETDHRIIDALRKGLHFIDERKSDGTPICKHFDLRNIKPISVARQSWHL